ncbi:hypothetical protein OH77DRAFT_1443378 [Trametes cingulata]|nr:hypothetical protein OH77DRAFT_1443378 [Trametes cingulata]
MDSTPQQSDFLDLPVELRLVIYEQFLVDHQQVRRKTQPSNAHIRLLYTCRQIAQEAAPVLRRYISLLHERQIQTFLLHAPPSLCTQVEWADVANDGRVFRGGETDQEDKPLSSLHVALDRMTALRRLRVFQCRQGLPINLQNTMSLHRSRRLGLRFERAMFPRNAPALQMYELHISPETRVELFDALSPRALVALRLSGEIVAPPGERNPMPVPALRHLTLHGITGNFFDRHTVDECFPGARLQSFAYALGHRLGFELRNHHLDSLAAVYGNSLRELVLLGCSRLSSTNISRCLESLPVLEYFALHLVTVDELRSNFVLSLPPKLTVFKLQVINAWYAIALKEEERGLCDAIETAVLLREPRYRHVCVCFRTQLMTEDGRRDRWENIARDRGVNLEIGPWESRMMDEI